MRKYLLLISILLLSLTSLTVQAQDSLMVQQPPLSDSIGCKTKYATTIELSKGYLSGITIMVREADVYHGVLFNEFGITALEFTYQPQTKKVELIEVIAMLDKWYIRRVLKIDLQHVMGNLLKGNPTYKDEKYHISYKFSVMSNDENASIEEGENDATKE